MSSSTTCNTLEFGYVKFVYSNESNSYVRVGTASEEEVFGSTTTATPTEDGGGLRRMAAAVTTSKTTRTTTTTKSMKFLGHDSPLIFPPIFASNSDTMDERFLDENTLDEGGVVYGRQCICARTDHVYCPVGADLCRIVAPNSYSYRVQCEGDVRGLVSRFFFLLCIFFYLLFAVLLVCSPKREYATRHFKKVLCCWKEDRYEQELRREIDHMAGVSYRRRQRARSHPPRRVHYNRRGQVVIDPIAMLQDMQHRNPAVTGAAQGGGGDGAAMTTTEVQAVQKVAVGLKTRLYKQEENDDDNEQEENARECAICLAPLVPGERVGDLKCGHVFHVDPCLKQWIVRRNNCPLCKSVTLADRHEAATTEPRTTDEAGASSTAGE